MSQQQIQQLWQQINEVLEMQCGKFSLRQLCTRKWYLQVLNTIYPELAQKLSSVKKLQNEEAAIDRILLILTEEEVIEQDFLEIKGRDIVIGDAQSIFYIVQLFMALVQKELQEVDQNQQEGGQQGEQEQQQYQETQQELDEQKEYISNHLNPKNNQGKSKINERQNHSVLGISKQFQNQQSQQQYKKNNRNFQSKFQKQESQQSNDAFQNVYSNNNKNYKKSMDKPNKMMKNEKETNYRSNQQNDHEQFNTKTLNRYKSQENLNKGVNKNSKEFMQNRSGKNTTKKVRKLVNHPVIEKEYPKATTLEDKKITKEVKQAIREKRKKNDKQNVNTKKITSQELLGKKKRELRNVMENTRKQEKGLTKVKSYDLLKEKNNHKLQKLLKWKQANLEQQKKQLQSTMQMKVQLKKQNYIKQINNLILNLEKKRTIDKKREEQEKLRKEKQLADKRLQAIQTQFKTQMKLLREKGQEAQNKKTFNQTDHRSIVEGLQKQLRRQNQKQLSSIKLRFRREEIQLQDDLEKLQKQIMRAYQKN